MVISFQIILLFFLLLLFQVLGFLLCWEKQRLYLHWYHKVGHLNLQIGGLRPGLNVPLWH